jgi:HEAT repeat protein
VCWEHIASVVGGDGDYDSQYRVHHIEILGKMGPAAERAVPLLIHATLESDPAIREAAAAALQQIEAKGLDGG